MRGPGRRFQLPADGSGEGPGQLSRKAQNRSVTETMEGKHDWNFSSQLAQGRCLQRRRCGCARFGRVRPADRGHQGRGRPGRDRRGRQAHLGSEARAHRGRPDLPDRRHRGARHRRRLLRQLLRAVRGPERRQDHPRGEGRRAQWPWRGRHRRYRLARLGRPGPEVRQIPGDGALGLHLRQPLPRVARGQVVPRVRALHELVPRHGRGQRRQLHGHRGLQLHGAPGDRLLPLHVRRPHLRRAHHGRFRRVHVRGRGPEGRRRVRLRDARCAAGAGRVREGDRRHLPEQGSNGLGTFWAT